jgi:GNAT superfamily N-acetyltransferase
VSTDSPATPVSTANSLSDYCKDIILRDGTVMKLRSLRPSDREELKALGNRCSPESLRYRFLISIKMLPDEMLNRLLNVDGAQRVALVVVQGDCETKQIVAVGRYNAIEERPQVAEVAFLVEDAFQKRGIGTLLLDALAEVGRDHGITHFAADVLVDNHTMLNVFRAAGYALESHASFGVTHIEFPIAETEAAKTRAATQRHEAEDARLKL